PPRSTLFPYTTLFRSGVVRPEDDDLAQARALGKAVALLLAVVALAELLVRHLFAVAQLAPEDLIHQQRLAQALLHVGAGHARLAQRVLELRVGLHAVLLHEALRGVLQVLAGDGDAEAVRAVLDEQLGD